MRKCGAAQVCGLVFLAVVVAIPFRVADAGEALGPTVLPPAQGGFTQSLGMPPVYKGNAGFEFAGYRLADGGQTGVYGNVGLFKDLGSPVVGLAGLGLQGYVGAHGDKFDGGGRALFTIPSFRLNLGVDYNIPEEKMAFLLGLGVPLRRGGVFGNGSLLMIRWLPARAQTFTLGVDWPLWGSSLGDTRAKQDAVTLDRREPKRLETTSEFDDLEMDLAQLRERARWIARLSQPFTDVSGADPAKAVAGPVADVTRHWSETNKDFPNGQTLNEEIRVYHETLERAFQKAAGDARGSRLSMIARRILLEDVLAPYNYLLGQRKKNDDLTGYIATAQSRFTRIALSDSMGLTVDQVRRVVWVDQALCDLVEANRRELRERWESSRFVWLPLQYALRPEEHDSQAELDELIELCTHERFSQGNRVNYVLNEEFQGELARSIRAAEDYHVLWVHDFRGLNSHKQPDEIAYMQVRSYLDALIDRVKAYDRTGRLPVYMIMLDQHYFEINKSRRWLRLLREPLDEKIALGADLAVWEHELGALQDTLRSAVEASTLLRLERGQYGEKWLRNRIRVNISITNPADNSFISRHVAGIVAIPDNMMRDHRKIAFYDVTEADPYRGAAIFTGMGIGEHYVGSSWEDRAVILRGPEALDVKKAAAHLLTVNGFKENEMPFPLRPVPYGADYDEKVRKFLAAYPPELEAKFRVLQLHNETGYEQKPINVAKAVLYSLMPPGSTMRIPDSLWLSTFYASLLTGSALRGCRVVMIAPRLISAPSAAGVTMARAHALLGRVLAFVNGAEQPVRSAGGFLRVGLYSPRGGVRDLATRFEQATKENRLWSTGEGVENPEFARAVAGVRAQLDSLGYSPQYLGEDSLFLPKLHLKANFFATREAWEGLFSRPEWGSVFREYIAYLAQQQPDSTGSGLLYRRSDATKLTNEAVRLLVNYRRELTTAERDRFVLYLTVGSVNMDYRSMVMDGEAMITLTGGPAMNGMIDFMMLTGMCEWPTTPEELDQLLPPPTGFMRTMGGLLKLSL